MKDDDSLLWPLARMFAGISVVAIGGANASVPEIHLRVVEQARWMSEDTFVNLYAISQAAPGPNVLIVSLVGWQVAGLAGLLVATLAGLGPSCLIALGAGRLVKRVSGTRAFAIAQDALVPIAVGLIIASGVVMARAASEAVLLALITAGSAAFVILTNRNPLWALLVGMVATGAAHLLT